LALEEVAAVEEGGEVFSAGNGAGSAAAVWRGKREIAFALIAGQLFLIGEGSHASKQNVLNAIHL